VHSGSVIDGINIFNVDLEHRKLMLVGVISANPVHRKHKNSYKLKNEHFYFNPDPNFVLQAGDLLVVLGRVIAIDYFRDQIEKSRIGNGLKP
jgi:voltage-gated potassium channel